MHKFLKKYPYYGQDGITATSANYIANLGKEYYASILKRLKAVSFYSVETTIAGTDYSYTTKASMSRADFEAIPESLREIYSINALIAWLREAIKTRQEMMDELSDLSVDEYAKITKQQPVGEHDAELYYVLHDASYDIEADERWDIDKQWQNVLNAEKAQISRDALQQLQHGVQEVSKYNAAPTTVEDFTSGTTKTNGVICTALTCSLADMLEMEQNIRNLYVGSADALNPIKDAKEMETRQANLARNHAKKELQERIESHQIALQNDSKVYRSKMRSEISRLRIVIPESLRPLYEKLSALK